jgi:CheY-like chemotaxis protein
MELDSRLQPVRADPSQIDQIVMNLVVNAGDAMPGGGRLELATRNAQLGAADARRLGMAPGPAVCLAVRDTGTGMDAATQARIFEPFFTTKGLGKGTGLGLSTVYGIVKQWGWGIEVESALGQGSVFRIYIPAAERGPAAGVEPAGPALEMTRAHTVLLVEDDPLVREIATEVLESAGHRVLAARGPEQALELAERHGGGISLLLADVVMRPISGPQLAERLRQRIPDLRVLLMSGYPDPELASRGTPGAQELLRKPFSGAELLERLRKALP